MNDVRWLTRMDETFGKIGEVKSIAGEEYLVEFKTGLNSCLHAQFWYVPEWLILVKEPLLQLPFRYEPGDETNEMYEFAPEIQRKMQKYNNLLPINRCSFAPPNII
jgi:hypothetical protein